MEGLLYEIVTDMKINHSLTMKNKQLRAKLRKVRRNLAQAMHSQQRLQDPQEKAQAHERSQCH